MRAGPFVGKGIDGATNHDGATGGTFGYFDRRILRYGGYSASSRRIAVDGRHEGRTATPGLLASENGRRDGPTLRLPRKKSVADTFRVVVSGLSTRAARVAGSRQAVCRIRKTRRGGCRAGAASGARPPLRAMAQTGLADLR